MFVPAHNHPASTRQGAGNEFIIIGIIADRLRQDRLGEDFRLRGNKVNDRLRVNSRKLLSQCFAYPLILFKDFPGKDRLQFSVSPGLE
jgi:hypothetical protein